MMKQMPMTDLYDVTSYDASIHNHPNKQYQVMEPSICLEPPSDCQCLFSLQHGIHCLRPSSEVCCGCKLQQQVSPSNSFLYLSSSYTCSSSSSTTTQSMSTTPTMQPSSSSTSLLASTDYQLTRSPPSPIKKSTPPPHYLQPLKKRNRECYEHHHIHNHHHQLSDSNAQYLQKPCALASENLLKKRKQSIDYSVSQPALPTTSCVPETKIFREEVNHSHHCPVSLEEERNSKDDIKSDESDDGHDDSGMEKTTSSSEHESNHSEEEDNLPHLCQSINNQQVEFVVPKRKSNRGRKPKPKKVNVNEGPWTDEEHEQFLKGYQECGKNWSRIADLFVPSRRRTQIASHAQKWFRKREKK